MKRIAFGLILVLAVSFNPLAAIAVPKAGSACAKQGLTKSYQGKKFTCVKSDKKLVWSKGVVTKQSAPVPTSTKALEPTPSPSTTSKPKENFLPWSTEFSTEVMSETAFESFANWAKDQSARPVNHQILIQSSSSGYSPTILEDLKALDDASSRVFSQFMKKKSVTVIGLDESWVVSQILGSGGHLKNMQGRCDEPVGVNYSICMNRDSHLGIVIRSDCKMPKGSVLGCVLGILPHEYFHLIQLNLADNLEGAHWNYGEDYAKNSFPHWFVEGSADFVASVMVSFAKNSKYENSRSEHVPGVPGSMAYALIDYEVHGPSGNNLYSYNIGYIATEYIVASVGFQKFLDIWKDYSRTRNFYTSFEKVTGRSVATFYADFESARASLGVPPVTRKRN